MLSVKELTKIYSSGTASVTALNKVNFTLEDKGFVFITGKSGCGKTTLLSIIGGLDNATEGTIICDGNDLSKFSSKDFDNYRNTYLGFIFQDYCLIDDLNVYQNIEISLNLKGEALTQAEKDKLIEDALASVDLDFAIKNRYIKELSGGQKQRIAIARALIKNPKLILADEPTGNLDSKTSKKILKLLKKLSKDRLVLIVSHNADDARTYADRIIEFADGEIVSDIHRNHEDTEDMSIVNGTLILPHSGNLTPSQIKEINENLKENKITKIKQHTSGFEKTKEIKENHNKFEIEPKKMKFKSSLKLSKFFIRKRWLASCVTILTTALLVFVLGLSQFLIQFKEAETILGVMQQAEEKDLLLYNAYYNEDSEEIEKNYIVRLDDSQIAEFQATDYTGNIYKLYNDIFCINNVNLESGNLPNMWKNINGKWINETYGTLHCDSDYLIRRFGVNGEIPVLAGDLTDKPYGIIITDYVADSFLNQHKLIDLTYEDLVGTVLQHRCYINAIIDTDYETFNDLFKYLEDTAIGIDRSSEKDFFKTRLLEFFNCVQKYYGVSYSIDPNYEQEIGAIRESHTYLINSTFNAENFSLSQNQTLIYPYSALEPNEIGIEYDIFNAKFGKFFGYYTEENFDTYEPITLTINKYDTRNHTELVYSTEVKIILLPTDFNHSTNVKSSAFFASQELFETIKENNLFAYGLYFDDTSQLSTIYPTLVNNPYNIQSTIFNSLSSVGDIVSVFEEFFWIIFLGISGVCLVLLISYAYGNIKKKYYEIGVLKALGATTRNVGFLFSLQTILAGILICILSNTALFTLCTPINITISNKLLEFVANNNLGPLSILQVNLPTIIANTAVILFVTTLTCFIPMAKLHKIKPKNIIANRD